MIGSERRLALGSVLVDGIGGLWLQNRRCAMRVGGFAFEPMARALASLSNGRVDTFRSHLLRGGMGEPEARALFKHLRTTSFLSTDDRPRAWMSDRQIRRALQGASPLRIRVRVGPLAASDVEAPRGEVLVHLGAAGWRIGSFEGSCRKCAVLWEIQESRSPGDWAAVVDAGPYRAAVVLAEGDLALLRATLGSLSRELGAGATPGAWLAGRYGAEAASALRMPRAACCDACPQVPARRSAPKSVAALAATSAGRLGIRVRERRIKAAKGASFAGLPQVVANFSVATQRARDARFVGGYVGQAGCGLTLAKRVLTARMEVIERGCAMSRAPDVVQTPLRELRQPHLPMARWALYSDAQHAQPDFPYPRPEPDTPLDWVWAESLGSGQRMLVPAALTLSQATDPIVASNSTGLAAHVRREAAILGGLREAIERDALVLAWYRGRGARRIEPDAVGKGLSARALAWLERRGWRISFALVPGRAGLSVVAAIGELAEDQTPLRKGGFVFGASASASVTRAAAHALEEVVMIVESLGGVTADVFEDPVDLEPLWYVQGELDKILHLYLRPEMRPALDFFLEGPVQRGPFADERDDLDVLLRRLTAEGLEALVVDLSDSRTEPLVAVQVLLLGAQPMAFGMGQLRMGSGLLPSRLPRRAPPPPPPGFRPGTRSINPYPLPLA